MKKNHSHYGGGVTLVSPQKIFLKMKVTLFVVLFSAIQVLATGAYSQTKGFTLAKENTTLENVLKAIEDQSNYYFLYNGSLIDVSQKINVKLENQSLEATLQALFKDADVTYKIYNRQIVLSPAKTAADVQQSMEVKGNVSDASGAPLPGVTVIIKGTTTGTITDFDGNYVLSNVAEGSTLLFSFVGMKPQEVIVGNTSTIDVTLAEESIGIEEVVAIGYGTQKKVNLTGSVSTIDFANEIESRPVTTTSSGLQGAIPNLQITPESGKPGHSASINVRGTTSINGGGPLVLVDGVEMSMDLVNPNDIANVSVLKDAAASSIYGVRAAYGVVLITTKSAGKEGETTVSYSGNVAFSKPTVLPDMVGTSYEHAEFINKALLNANIGVMFEDDHIEGMKAWAQDPTNNPESEIIQGTYRFYGHTNWVDLMMKNSALSHRHNINVSGGGEKTRFYSSIGFVEQQGIIRYAEDKYQRLNTRLSVENQTNDWMKLGFKLLYNYVGEDEPHKYKDDVFRQMVFSSPVRLATPFLGDPNFPEYDPFIGKYFDDQNPISLLKEGGRDMSNTHDIWASVSADLDIMEDWTARIDFTYNRKMDRFSEHRKRIDMITSSFVETEGNTNNNSYKQISRDKSYSSFNAWTQYEKTLGEKHYVKGMVGFNQELTQYSSFSALRRELLSQNLPSLSLGVGDQQVAESGYEWALRGGFFRANYIFDDRYLVEVNGRYDGTSRFPKDNRFVFLPSFSLAWRLSEEAFMESTRGWLDNLKVRGSYGLLGNQLLTAKTWSGNTKYYPYIPFMASGFAGNYLFGTEQDLLINPAGLVSNSLTWEKASTVNFGFDVTMLNQRLDASFDWYRRTTSDMLVKVEYPELLGTSAPPANKAELQTTGWELSVSWKDRIGKDFSYGVGVILSDSQAEITKYDNPTNSLGDHYVGKKIGEVWGYETEGFFAVGEDIASYADQSKLGANWKAGDIKYADINNDGFVNNGKNTLEDHGDLKVIGNTTPRYQYGITADVTYKNLYMNLFLQGVGKRDFWPSSEEFWPVATQYYNTQTWFLTDTWTEDNPNTYFPRPIARETKNRQQQSKYMQDASYIRLKSISVGYNIPRNWLDVLRIAKASVFVSGENLWEHSNIKGPYDPEAAKGNGAMLYPFQRTYSVGVNVTF